LLAQLNVWIDALALTMVVGAALFWVVQIIGNSMSGRFRQKFNYGLWPEHDEIVPIFPRLIHAVHVFTMIALIVSGFYIRFPFYPGLKAFNQQVHYVAMYVVVAGLVIRVIYAMFRDKKQFILTLQDLKIMPQAFMYYMFVRKQYPHIHKYNGLQKSTYGYLFPISLTLMAITGFSMMWPDILLGWTGAYGTAAAYLRAVHFFLAALVVTFVLIHVCLSFVEDYPALLIFFGLRRQYWEEDYDEYYEDDEVFHDEVGDEQL